MGGQEIPVPVDGVVPSGSIRTFGPCNPAMSTALVRSSTGEVLSEAHTSQVPVSQWHSIIADPTLGDAILDRIIHNAHRIELKGYSLRRQAGEKKKP